MTTEQYFYRIKTPIWKAIGMHTSAFHLWVCINQGKKRFEGNFICGFHESFYKKNFKAKTLNGLLKKIYTYRKIK